MEGFLSRGMEKLGLSEGAAQFQGGSTGSSRKPPVRFIINPGDVDVIAEFAGFNSGSSNSVHDNRCC